MLSATTAEFVSYVITVVISDRSSSSSSSSNCSQTPSRIGRSAGLSAVNRLALLHADAAAAAAASRVDGTARVGLAPGGDSPTPTTDRRSLLTFIRRCIRTGFCSPDLADFHDLYISSDEKQFSRILTCPNHILPTLLPPPTAQNYSLRNRPHNRQPPDRIYRITDCNFTVRMLYRNIH